MSEGSALGFDLLYIAGTARSGSTVLAILLGAAEGVTAVGELSFFFRDVYNEERGCGCGRPAPSCPLWSRVRSTGGWVRREAIELEALTRRVDAHAGVPRLAVGRPSADLDRYCSAHARVLAAVRQVTGDAVIVDSSKYVARALALGRCFGDRVRVLSLTRGARGVIHSFLKPNQTEQRRSSVTFAAAYYPMVLTQLRALGWRLDDVLELTYEELCRDPVAALDRVEGWSGLDLSTPRAMLRDGTSFDIGHLVTANRLRKRTSFRFRPELDVELTGAGARMTAGALDLYRRLLGFR